MSLLNYFRTQPIETLKEEVCDSLKNLFVTKQSYGAWQKNLGLKDYSGANFTKDTIKSIEEDMAWNIQTYEKRIELESVKVSSFKSYADFEVEITGRVEEEKVVFFVHITRRKETNVSIRFF